MPIIAGATAAAVAGTGNTLFGYNRENYLYDRKMRQETEYQIMDFRIKQAELWREDVKDIIGLTSVKMDTYLIVNAVQLGFTVMAFCEGRLATGTPTWLVGCHTLSLSGAFMYLLMSVWFSMHASVTAKSYEVRLLTQLVRLPVPSWTQLEGARTYGSTFEKTQTKQMFRVPFVMGTQNGVLGEAPAAGSQSGEGAEVPSGSSDLWGLEGRGDSLYELDGSVRTEPDSQRHLKLIKQVMHYWQSYDGFARVAMSMGTNQLIAGLSYYVIAYVLISNKAVVACFLVVMLFMVIATALIRLDMSLTGLEFRTAVALVIAGPCLAALAAQQWRLHTIRGYEMVHLLAPMPYAFSAAWLMFLLYISKVGMQEGGAMLPTGFRSVMYIDVFGWIKRASERSEQIRNGRAAAAAATDSEAPPPASGVGPAMSSTAYDGCFLKKPKPTRPEQLPGAAKTPPEFFANPEMFDPTTFVPRESEYAKANHDHDVQPYLAPGYVPWRIFCSATSMLLTLWWISGVLMLLQASGWGELRVSPLLTAESEGPEPVEEAEHGAGPSLLLESSTSKSAHRMAFVQFGSSTAEMHLVGEEIETHWPHLAGAAPSHLACGLDKDGKTALAATSRFGLFTANLESRDESAGNRSIAFQYAPPCDKLDGEALQDVTMRCEGKDRSCQALVLHRQGQRLTSCALSNEARSIAGLDSFPSLMSLSDGWLGEGDAAVGQPQEEVASIALAGRCSDSEGQCAYAETTSGRVVEMKTGIGDAQKADWYPTRTLLADVSNSKGRRGGAMHMLGHQHIGVLAKDGRELRAIDVRNGGKLAGRWPLPSEKRWSSMCSAADGIFLLGQGGKEERPQLFRFPLPSSLQDDLLPEPIVAEKASSVKKASRARATSKLTKGVIATEGP
mmetsp:Transcript_98457/g.175375  ORF Transcript_98457/g.175375 Transcript_98457/m.175375 type:complete len:897 (+) Transcript_98457:128-2818(+)|eukprot:CAMPEP_0197661406 /NCGR_PEP_ID=MMETSP1338-20131121/51436_1 /TAXON_ID=43686 ORGANISM="Pelagodinium beii, Strain RCC1491" /NCGR_SAMPLE_ID=MMETSP1338 /ASSEMBLY_ACC=CAM_ASM_000754 /LENGTH=896 /DNA_ID=CAMNT_0043238957 /DNA_START=116 /DNA_END=2806 /DNA_ORIENTATION=-